MPKKRIRRRKPGTDPEKETIWGTDTVSDDKTAELTAEQPDEIVGGRSLNRAENNAMVEFYLRMNTYKSAGKRTDEEYSETRAIALDHQKPIRNLPSGSSNVVAVIFVLALALNLVLPKNMDS